MGSHRKVKRGVSEYWEGSIAYLVLLDREKRGKPNFVGGEEANRRAAICCLCPFNGEASGTLEKITDAAILKRTGGRTTSLDSDLGNCDACSCPLKLSVHLHPEVLQKTKRPAILRKRIRKRERITGKKINPHCWQLKIITSK